MLVGDQVVEIDGEALNGRKVSEVLQRSANVCQNIGPAFPIQQAPRAAPRQLVPRMRALRAKALCSLIGLRTLPQPRRPLHTFVILRSGK